MLDLTNLESLQMFTDELRQSLPIPALPKQVKDVEYPPDALYSVYKRSIPIGENKIVVTGCLRHEADKDIIRLIHGESKRRREEIVSGLNPETFYYFDIVPMDATEEERSIFYNPKRVTV